MAFKIEILHGDITTLEVDVLVNSVNNDLILGGGVSGAIRRVGGPAIQEECNKIGTVPLGEVAVTGAGDLKAKFVFHAAIQPLGLWADGNSIRKSVRNCFKRAIERQVKSIAFPAIGTGTGGFPVDKSAEIIADECVAASKAETPLERVIVSILDDKYFAMIAETFRARAPAELIGTVSPIPSTAADVRRPPTEGR